MKKIPFDYGSLAQGDSFINRVNERAMLKQFLLSGINVMLISPRRWGKSSLVQATMNEIAQEQKNVKICFIDAFRFANEAEFLRAFSSAIFRACAGTIEQYLSDVSNFLKNLSPKISFGSDPTNMASFEISFGENTISQEGIETILNLPEKLARSKKIRLIVCIDEFQALAEFPTYKSLEGKMRSVWQHHENAVYCLYGSKRHMMNEIFNNSANPFYRFGQILFLEKIAEQEWVEYLISGFRRAGKKISAQLATQIVNTAERHSWYVQQLAFFTWSQTLGNEVSNADFERALRHVISTNEPMFINDTEKLNSSQLNLLRAIANGETHFNSKRVNTRYSLGVGPTIARNKKLLENADLITRDGEGYAFLDPIYKRWFLQEKMGTL